MSPPTPQGDSLVKEIVLLNRRPFYFHGYFAPFILAYAIGAGIWNNYFGMERYEVGIILGICILFFQVLAILFCLWSINFRCWMMYSKVRTAEHASFAKVTPTSHNGSVELVVVHRTISDNQITKIWIDFQKVTYVYDHEEKKCFEPIQFPIQETFCFYQSSRGFQTETEYESSKKLYGSNIMEMVIPDFTELFIERASAPFFVFQVFCVGLWCLDEYWYYSLFTLFMLIAFEASLVYQQLRNMAEIRKMGNQPYDIYVFRFRKWRLVQSNQLVSGDIISLTRSSSTAGEERSMPCDILLLRGRLIVDEAMLTGESVPQMKDPIENSHGDTILDISVHSRVHVISGGTRIVQHDPPPRRNSNGSNTVQEGASRPPDNGCLGYVLRTGFNTSQGKLLRTILFGVKRVTANSLETFAFIMFLLIFAIAASSYVWVVGSANPNRSRYKLVLNCVLILTSVVPPELPIELSLAVNSSLLALTKLLVYCTEPFRIPFAGKIDICCFDKTGTLTSDCLVVEGVAGISKSSDDLSDEKSDLCPVPETPPITQMVLATCHALVKMDDELVGDPMEQAMLRAVEWNLTKGDVVIPKKRTPGLQPSKIVQRFHFSSLLKRMSTVVSQEEFGQTDLNYFATVKGAAETLKPMFSSTPDNYDQQHQELAQRGARVLALGFRNLGKGLTSQQIRDLKRHDIEKELTFAGFVTLSSPLKHDSKAIMREIRHSTHYVTMITGDNPLTACYVGKVLRFCTKSACLIFTNLGEDRWSWRSSDCKTEVALDLKNWKKLVTSGYDLCLTGDGLSYLQSVDATYLNKIIPSVRIFARVSPKQKEQVITTMKQQGFNVLMCGDGTNDVGALKHAHVGVALLSHTSGANPREGQGSTKDKHSDTKGKENSNERKTDGGKTGRVRSRGVPRSDKEAPRLPKSRVQQQQEDLARKRQKLQEMIGEMEVDPQVVKMGDASIAAPFSYKLSSIVAICHIIKQGRCTLVTTLQMFKILALNALVLAYSQSVLYLDGVKFSDGQATLQGLLLAGCFLFISRSKPLKVLSKERPLPNIFNVYTILTITLQFAIHFASLVFLVREAKVRDPRDDVDIEADFEANLLNSTVYVLSLATQIMTFALNYRGHPFMESLFENKPLMYSLMGSSAFLVALVTGVVPDVNDQFQIVLFEPEFRLVILQVLGGILVSTWCIDRSLRFLLGAGRLRRLS